MATGWLVGEVAAGVGNAVALGADARASDGAKTTGADEGEELGGAGIGVAVGGEIATEG